MRGWSCLLWATLVAWALSACGGDDGAPPSAACSSNLQCQPGHACVGGICTPPPAPDAARRDTDDAGDDRGQDALGSCRDFDEDGVRSGPGCDDEALDCNDFDGRVYPGADEVCDGVDNDCDEAVDLADPDYRPAPCPRTEGVCAGATRECVAGRLQSCTEDTYQRAAAALDTVYVANESDCGDREDLCCDGADNDCDGRIDEDIELRCYTGDPADLRPGVPCRAGRRRCDPTSGTFSDDCEGEVLPEPEDTLSTRCDGVDNSCDGTVDENCSCQPGETRDCYDLVVVCAEAGGDCPEGFVCNVEARRCEPVNPPCRMGLRSCGDDGRFEVECKGQVLPGIPSLTEAEPESCGNPGIDNDCDGDNTLFDIEDYGVSCTVDGAQGACRSGHLGCVGAALECVADRLPVGETCLNDGADDDCNGTADDVPGRGSTCWVSVFLSQPVEGLCQVGRYGCRACTDDADCPADDLGEVGCVSGTCERLVCVPRAVASERCNGLDDDCDGDVDNPELVSTDDDPLNCGACGYECGGERPPDCCQGRCVDLHRDTVWPPSGGDLPTDCGSCGLDCGTGGELRPACCGGECTDLAADEGHCGRCDRVCGELETCCDGQCVDTLSDDDHCGPVDSAACYGPCRAGVEHCCGGSCEPLDNPDACGSLCDDCVGDTACCDVEGTLQCQSLAEDGFCGACGVTCSEGGDPACCDSSCADRDVDFDHCGACDAACGGADDACCPPDGHAGSGHCADFELDFDDCGACGESCSAPGGDTACCEGVCRDTTRDLANCDACGRDCAVVNPDAEACCPVLDEEGSPTGAGQCVDLEANPEHCGGCDVECATGEQCCGGFCRAVDDVDHCGGCDVACSLSIGQRCCSFDGGGTYTCAVTTDGTCGTATPP